MNDPTIKKRGIDGPRDGLRYGFLLEVGDDVQLVSSEGERWTSDWISLLTPYGGRSEGVSKLPRPRRYLPTGQIAVQGDNVVFMHLGGNRKFAVILGCAVQIGARAELPYRFAGADPNVFTATFAPDAGGETTVRVDGGGIAVSAPVVQVNGGEALVKVSFLEQLDDVLTELIAAHTAAVGIPPVHATALKASLALDLGGGVGTYHTRSLTSS